MDSNFHQLLGPDAGRMVGSIVLEDRVWVGAHAIILRGVEIGEGAVVAAGSVVVSNVPSRCLVAGNPARIVRRNVDWRP